LEALEQSDPPKLVRFLPEFHGSERERRNVSLAVDIHEWLMRPVTSEFLTRLKAAVKVHLAQFVKGDEIDDCEFMKRVARKRSGRNDFSEQVWSVRPDFIPRYRFFGTFFRADCLVIFTKMPRDDLNTDDKWHAQIDAVRRSWTALFPGHSSHSGDHFPDYVTFNAEHCDERW
jgi:hypothetical protein